MLRRYRLPPAVAARASHPALAYGVLGLAWLGRYLTLGNLPWLGAPLWLPWFDQARYLRSTIALAHGVLLPAEHWYPLLYSICAVPFALLTPSDPFFLLDLGLYLLTFTAFARIAALVGVSRVTATLCFGLTTLVQSGLASAWVHPWTTTLSAALSWWLLYLIVRAQRGEGDRARLSPIAAGMLIAALPLVRPLDAIVGAVGGALILLATWRRHASLVRCVTGLMLGAAIVGLPYALLYIAIYGPHPSAYMVAAAHAGFAVTDLGWKAYTILVRAEPWYPGSRTVLQALPWMVPGVAGLIVGAVRSPADRPAILTFGLLALPVSALMLTYTDLQPPGLWEFCNIHYFKWIMPMLGLGVVWFVRACLTPADRPATALAAALLAVVLCIRIDPVPVGDATPARMLWYRGRPGRDWAEAYFAPVIIHDGQGALRNVDDFHQLPDGDRQRAVAIRRLFDRQPRRFDPQDARAGYGRLPDARFGERVSFLGLQLGR